MFELIKKEIISIIDKHKEALKLLGEYKESDVFNLIIFKSAKQKKEWKSRKLNDKLKFLVEALALISWGMWGKHLVITEIYRSQKANEKIYAWNGEGKAPVSVHTFWRGIDIRTKNYTKDEAKMLTEIANCIPYDKDKPRKKTAIYGVKRHYDHIHLQVKG